MKDPFPMEDAAAAATAKSLSSDALTTTLCNSIQALGRGFNVTSDIRLLYCKGAPGSRLVHFDEEKTKDLLVCDGVTVPNVSIDVECSRGESRTETTRACSFDEVIVRSELLLGVGFFLFLIVLLVLKLLIWLL